MKYYNTGLISIMSVGIFLKLEQIRNEINKTNKKNILIHKTSLHKKIKDDNFNIKNKKYFIVDENQQNILYKEVCEVENIIFNDDINLKSKN
jgi:hypothetical protein